MLGEEHPNTARSLNNLGTLCCYENDFVKAAEFMRRALVIHRKVLGDDHPDTKSSIDSLGVIEKKMKGLIQK